jgi:hypothetical protein
MHRAGVAGRFLFAKFAMLYSFISIIEQFIAFGAKGIKAMMLLAINAYHGFNGTFFST